MLSEKWQALLDAFDAPARHDEASQVLTDALAKRSHGDAVKLLIALGAQVRTPGQRAGVAAVLSGRLNGALAWSLVHRNRDAAPAIVGDAIALRLRDAPPEEQDRLQMMLSGIPSFHAEIKIRNEAHLRNVLAARVRSLPEINVLNHNTQGRFQHVFVEFVAFWAEEEDDWGRCWQARTNLTAARTDHWHGRR